MSRRRGGRLRHRPGGSGLPRALALVPSVLGQLADWSGILDGWTVLDASWTMTGTATILLGLAGRSPAAVLRMSWTGAERLRRESAVLVTLATLLEHADPGPPITRRRHEGAVQDWYYVLDEYIDGLDAVEALAAAPSLRPAVERAGVGAATCLHRATARPVTVDEELVRRWVDEPVDVLTRELRRSSRLVTRGRLEALRWRLRRSLVGRRVQAGWIHGDFWWGNIRVDPATGGVTGVVDWDCAERDELPAHDLLHLALYGESLRRGVSLGRLVAGVVAAGSWSADCERLIRQGRWAWAGQLSDVDVALLYWLRYTAMMIAQQRDYVDHSILVWEWRNVVPVLRSIGSGGDPVLRRVVPETAAVDGVQLGGAPTR